MAAPIISIVDSSGTTISSWDAGIVQSNNDSSILSINIWNNKGGSSTVPDLRECNITSLDPSGTANQDIITQKWVRVNVPSLDGNTTTYTQVGGSITKSLRANGLSSPDGYTIKGTANTGVEAASSDNFCSVNMYVHVPTGITASTRDWKMRINGYYV